MIAAVLLVFSVSLPAAAAITMKGAVLKTKVITIGAASAGGGEPCPNG